MNKNVKQKWVGLLVLSGAVLALNLSSSPVFAAERETPPPPSSLGGSGGNGQRIAPSNTKVKVTERDDNVVEQKKQPKSKREKEEEAGGRISHNEIEQTKIQGALSGALDQEISYMEKLLFKLPKNSRQRPEVLSRLTENIHQRSLLTFFEESRRYDIAWKKWNEGGRRGTEPVLDQRTSRTWTNKVIQRAQQMITDYPKYPTIDTAYYQIAYAFEQLGKRKEAAGYYSQLVARFPSSKKIADAQFSLGEYYFDNQDYRKALTSYGEVRRFPNTPIYPWAVYKMAWAYFNLQDYRNALGQWQQVVKISASSNLSQQGKIRLRDEALRDMVNAYAELGDIAGAEQYFAAAGTEKYFADLLLRLADLLRERGQYDQSVRVLKRFLARSPTNIRAAEIQIQIVDTANLKADKKLLWEEVKALLAGMGPNSQWAQRNQADPAFKDLSNRIHAVALSYPKKMHSLSQKDNNKYLYAQAITGYNIYLAYYGNRPEAAEVRFYLGEIQYSLGQYPEATRTFFALASLKQKTPFFQKSAEYLISSAYLPIDKDMRALRARPAKTGQQPIPVPQLMQDYLKTCEKYIEWFAKGQKVLNCQIDSAEIYLKHNNYTEAEKRLAAISREHADKPEGKKATEVLLYLAGGDKKKLLALADELSKNKAYNNGDLGKRLYSIRESQQFEVTQSLEKSGKFLKAAQEFERIGTTNPKGEDADKAWFNAGVNYRKANDPERSINAFTKVFNGYPKSAQAGDALFNVIDITSERMQFDRTAQHSAMFLARFPKDKRSPVITREMCYLYDAINDVNRATEACMKVINSRDPEAKTAATALADMYERNSRYREFVQIVDTVLLKQRNTESERVDLQGRAAAAERKMGRNGAARNRDAEIARVNPSRLQGAALAYVGKIEFDKHTAVMQRFQSTKLQARNRDGSDLQQSIKNKTGQLQAVEAAYKKVVATGDAEWGVAALYVIGSAYEMMAADLRNPPTPPGAPAAEVQKLREVLASLSKGPQEKAKAFFVQAAEVVGKFGIYTSFAKKNSEALARVAPKEFRKIDEWVPDVMFVGSQWMQVNASEKAIKRVSGGGE